MNRPDWARREFLAAGTLAGALAAGPGAEAAEAAAVPETVLPVRLEVNGAVREPSLDTGTSLLDALREHPGLTGAEKGATTSGAGPARSSSRAGGSCPA